MLVDSTATKRQSCSTPKLVPYVVVYRIKMIIWYFRLEQNNPPYLNLQYGKAKNRAKESMYF